MSFILRVFKCLSAYNAFESRFTGKSALQLGQIDFSKDSLRSC